jgi:hypothetical protein
VKKMEKVTLKLRKEHKQMIEEMKLLVNFPGRTEDLLLTMLEVQYIALSSQCCCDLEGMKC